MLDKTGAPHSEAESRFLGQYRTNRQESLTRDFSSEKGVKPQEYFVYFKVFGRISGGKDLGDPAKAQRQRVWWGKEEQRSD